MSAKEEDQQKIKAKKDNATTPIKTPKITWIALILSLSSLLFFVGFFAQTTHQQQEISAQLNLVEKSNHQHINEAIALMQSKWSSLDKDIHNALQQQTPPNSHWLLLKARYYLELAQVQAHWGNSHDLIQALLQEASQTLTSFHDPEVLTIRQAIATDLATVQNTKTVDVAGVLSQLDGLQKNIMPLKMLNQSRLEAAAPSPTSSNSTWHSHLENSLARLNQLIVIRHQEARTEPVISPLLEEVLKEKILLNLQQAQWAVLHENEAVYQLTLKQALGTLKKNFGAQETLIEQFNQLLALSIQQKPIAIGEALPLLNDWIQKKETPVDGGTMQ